MRWLTDDHEFEAARLEAMACVFVDSRRESTTLELAEFDDAIICGAPFGDLLFRMMTRSGDMTFTYLVLRPDPIHYFFRHFRKFSALVFNTDDCANTYWDGLNTDPGGSPADAVGTNWYECAILPKSRAWFVHALRSDRANGGHLWLPPEWRGRISGERGFADRG